MTGYAVVLLNGADLDAGGWIPRILALDRANLGGVLESAGIAFPEERRRAGLADPEALAVILLRGGELAGYVHLAPDWRDRADLYVASLQLAAPYRGTTAFGLLFATACEAARVLPFRRITSNIQPTNAPMLALARRLGLTLTPLTDRPSVEVAAGREWLDSPAVRRIARRYDA
ncbi:MAG TPA: GNAT family N-acetyltransferase [Longimicrobium sp.]|nr:GNAT family N-acetyltransferase [Longimicrobium sp.]